MIPQLFLAPMEGVGDRLFRLAMAQIGGVDWACTEFIRVPKNAHCRSLARVYDPHETAPIPIAAQIMGYDPELMARMAQELEGRGAPRIDLNCGCPSNRVTGRGAGSTLLTDPDHLHLVAKAMVEAVKIPVSVKIRSGYEDTSKFEEICTTIEAAGASMITIHPRTKVEGYSGQANWSLLRRAKEILSIPVVGSGDVVSAEDAFRMHQETGCDGVMIGRGAIANPAIFQQIRGRQIDARLDFINYFYASFTDERPRTQINKLKQIARYMGFKEILRSQTASPEEFFHLLQQKALGDRLLAI